MPAVSADPRASSASAAPATAAHVGSTEDAAKKRDAADKRAFDLKLSDAWVADWTKKCANIKVGDAIMLKWGSPGNKGWYVANVEPVDDGEHSHKLATSDGQKVYLNLDDKLVWDGKTACGRETWVALKTKPLHEEAVTAAAADGTLRAPSAAQRGRPNDKKRKKPPYGPTSK